MILIWATYTLNQGYQITVWSNKSNHHHGRWKPKLLMADPLTVYTLCGLACILELFSPNKQVSFLQKNSRALPLDPPPRLCHVGVGLVFMVFINCITLRILLWHDFAYVRATRLVGSAVSGLTCFPLTSRSNEGTGTWPDYLVNRDDQKNEGPFRETNFTEIEK